MERLKNSCRRLCHDYHRGCSSASPWIWPFPVYQKEIACAAMIHQPTAEPAWPNKVLFG